MQQDKELGVHCSIKNVMQLAKFKQEWKNWVKCLLKNSNLSAAKWILSLSA